VMLELRASSGTAPPKRRREALPEDHEGVLVDGAPISASLCDFGLTFFHNARAQLDRGINQTLIPTHQNFGTGPSDGRPAFAFRESDFWAQGINFGLEFNF